MFRIFYAEKDATLYEQYENTNTGIDEVLEIGKCLQPDGSVKKSRSVVRFDMAEVSTAISKYNIDLSQAKVVLQLYTTHAKNLPAKFTIDAKIVAQPWENGTGFYSDTTAVADGVSWAMPYSTWSMDSKTSNMWISSSQNIRVNNSSLLVEGAGKGGSWLIQSGSSGTFNTSSFNQSYFTQGGLNITVGNMSLQPTDIYMDVTEAVRLWISGSGGQAIENNGFLLKFSDANEADNSNVGYIRYFSRETHTIYVPKLVLLWDNRTFETGSLSVANLESYSIYTGVKPAYKDTEIAKIRVYARDKYPRKSPTNLFPYETVKFLPTTTYYSVTDAATDETIIPYDDIYTKVSCDETSNFIYMDMNGFMPERNYRLQLKIVDGFTEQYIDDQIYFKVTR